MKSRKTKLRWLSAKNQPAHGAERAYALGVGAASGQRWHRSCVTAAPRPSETHQSVWASRRGDWQIAHSDTAAPWRSSDTGRDAEIRRKT